MEPKTSGSQPTTTHEPYERLPVLAGRNGFTSRQIFLFARQGLKVARLGGRKMVVSRQSWLDEFIASKINSDTHVTPEGR